MERETTVHVRESEEKLGQSSLATANPKHIYLAIFNNKIHDYFAIILKMRQTSTCNNNPISAVKLHLISTRKL